MDFSYLFRILMKRKWIVITATLIAAVAAYVLTLNQPHKFRSTAQVATGYTTYDPLKLVNENADYFSQETKFNNVIVTFTSPAVINLLLYNLILHDLKQTPFTVLKDEEKKKAFTGISKEEAIRSFQTRQDSMQMLSPTSVEDKKLLNLLAAYGYDYGTVINSLSVSRYQHSDYLNISYVSQNPSLSAFAVNTAYEQFIRYYGTNRDRTVSESIDTLKSIMEKKKQILDEKNRILQQAGIGSSEMRSTSDLNVIPNLENELTNQRSKLTTLRSDLRKVNQKIDVLNSRPTDNTAVNDEIIQLRTAMKNAYSDYLKSNDQADLKRYNSLNAKYQEKVLDSRSSGSETKDPVTEKIDLQSQKTDLEIDIQSTSSFISNLEGKIQSLKASISSNASHSAAGESLIQDAELANKEYLDAKQKYNQATDIGGASLVGFRLVVPGQPSFAPEPSKRMLIVVAAAFAAFFTTIAIIIFLTYLDSSTRTPLIFQKNVNLKLISLVNFMNLKNRNIKEVIANSYTTTDSEEASRNNTFRESLRKLRYEVEASGKKIFLFTSTKKGQGKTTLIQALSYSMSLSKKRVLIIDTNFCNNDLTVQLEAEPILEKIIPHNFDDKNLVEEIKKHSKDLGIGSIYAIGSAGGDYTPSEILPRENLLHHLQTLTSYFDYIFLEGPPLNDFSDSKELSQYVEGVIAVFSAQDEIKQIDRQSISFFKDDLNGKFCGSILNKVDLKNVNVI
jgi:succinoglycan biosynthesis transport protein ExoP